MNFLKAFLREQTGQDLIEYSLLLVFVLIASAVFIQGTGTSIATIWAAGSTTVGNAAAYTQQS
jgi:Flp pilus assembly pilin Flp